MKKTTIALGAGIALIGGTGIVNAEEVAPVTAEVTNEENNVVASPITEKQIAEAEATVATQNEVVAHAAGEVANISKEITSNENAASTANEAIQKLNTEKQDLNNINSEEIAKNVEAKHQEEKQASVEVESAANAEAEKAKQAQEAKRDADAKQTAVEAKERELKQTEQAIADKENKNNAELNKLKNNVAKADKEIADAKANVVAKENAYKNSRFYKAKESALKELDDMDNPVEEAKDKLTVAEEKLTAKKKEIETLENQDAVQKLYPYSLAFESTPEWNKAFSEYMKSRTAESPYVEEIKKLDPKTLSAAEFSKRLEELREQSVKWKTSLLNKQREVAIAVEPTTRPLLTAIKRIPGDEEVAYSLNELPKDVLIELSQYFAGLINQARKELGIEGKVRVHLDDIQFAKEVARQVEADRYTVSDHYGKAANNAARKRGLKTSAGEGVETTTQFYENLATQSLFLGDEGYPKVSKAELYKLVRKYFHGFMHEGKGNGHYLHAQSLMTIQNVGLDFSFIPPLEGKDSGSLKMHVISVPDATYNGDIEKQKEYYENSPELLALNEYPAENETSRKLQTLRSELPDLEKDYQLKLESYHFQLKNDFIKAAREIIERNFANTPLAELENNFKKAQSSLKEKEDAKDTAVKALDDYRKLLDGDDNLTVKRDEIAKELQSLQKAHEDSKAVYTKLTNELEGLQNVKVKAEDKLAKIQAELKELAKQEEQAKNKEIRLAEIAKEQEVLERQVDEAKNNIVKLTTKRKEAQDELEKAQAELKVAQNEYEKLAEQYRKEHLVMPEIAERPEVSTKEDVVTKPLPFKIVYIEDTTLPEGQEVVDVEGKDGVITLKQVSFFEGNTLLATDEVETSRQDAVNKVVRVGVKKKKEGIKPIIHKDKVPVQPQERPQAVVVKETAGVAPMAPSQTVVQTASQDKKVLPNTGDKHSSLAGLGLLGLAAGFVAVLKRKED